MDVRAGSLTSTYRVVRKYNLRAESEIAVAAVYDRRIYRRVSVIKESGSSTVAAVCDRRSDGVNLQIDQATKSASWMPWCQ